VSQVALGELGALYEAVPLSGPAPARPLLVKRLVPKHARNPEYQEALRREAELSASLLSSDIVRTLNIESAPELYAVMERIEGANLAVLLAQARQHDLETTRFAVPLIVGALRALDYLHRGHDPTGGAFLVHQAPVARHIMGDFEGRAHIIDLTLAMGPALPRAPLTDTRLRPYEMAPEQALAPHTVDPRCDIFIVGMTLWETLTGQRLFAGRSPIEAQKKMLSSSIVPPSETGTGTHHCFDRVCMRALARTRGTRFPSAGEMASELQDEAVRAGLYAEPEELAAWVQSTVALARRPVVARAPDDTFRPAAPQHALGQTPSYTAGHTQPRDAAQGGLLATRTMMGIGGPDTEVLRIAEAYRESESLKQTRNFRRPRGNGASRSSTPPPGSAERRAGREDRRSGRGSEAPEAPEARFSVVGSAEHESVPEQRSPSDVPRAPTGELLELGRPNVGPVTQLGLGGSDEWEADKRPSKRPSFATLTVAGVIAAGLLALMVRALPGTDAKPYSFEPAPVAPLTPSAVVAPSEGLAQPATNIAPPSVAAELGVTPTAEAQAPLEGASPNAPATTSTTAAETPPQLAAEPPAVPVEAVRSNPGASPLRARVEAPRTPTRGEAPRTPTRATRPASGARAIDTKRVTSTPAAPAPAAAHADAAPTATAAPAATRWEAPSTLRASSELTRAETGGPQQAAKWVAPSAPAKSAVGPDVPRRGNPPSSAAGASGLPDNPF
jgi:serine/threonine protein kinase